MKTSLPTPTTARVYVNLPEGIQWKNPLRKTQDHQASPHPFHLSLLDHVEGLAPVEPQEKMEMH